MIHKTFSLPPKVWKCVIFNLQSRRYIHLHLPLHQACSKKNVIDSVHSRPMVTTALRYKSKFKFTVKLPYRYFVT